MEMEGKVTSLRDMLASYFTLLRLNDINVSVPALIALRKQHDVVKGSIKRIQVTDVA
jgi:hypothetical protein